MKTKITVLFLILASTFVYYVFKGNYLSGGLGTEKLPSHFELTTDKIISKFMNTELKDYKGIGFKIDENSLEESKLVIVHMWASWCGPCVNEVPELVAYSKKHPEVKFIIISLDENKSDIEKFIKSFPDFNSDSFIKIWDGPSKLSQYFNVDRLPMSIILNKPSPQFVLSVVDWKNFKY